MEKEQEIYENIMSNLGSQIPLESRQEIAKLGLKIWLILIKEKQSTALIAVKHVTDQFMWHVMNEHTRSSVEEATNLLYCETDKIRH
jgi:hypothetical protein